MSKKEKIYNIFISTKIINKDNKLIYIIEAIINS